MIKRSCIYAIENVPTGMRYIGSTTDYYYRRAYHIHTLRNGIAHNKALQADYNKYGHQCFKFIVYSQKKNLIIIYYKFNLNNFL